MPDLSDTEKDALLQGDLYQKVQQRQDTRLNGKAFRNGVLLSTLTDSASYTSVFQLLEKKGTFEFHSESVCWQDTDGEQRQLSINRACTTTMWPMGTHFWVRDNALIASRLLNLSYDTFPYPAEWFQQGKQLLLSTLTIMSSLTQLKRFEEIINGTQPSANAVHWPHIFLPIEGNINAAEDVPWMHKQDAWQILCYVALDSLEKGFIKQSDLTEKHQRLLQLICPFLKAVDFTNCPNGGSWEEIEAVRSSVILWETALLQKVMHSTTFSHPEAAELFEKGMAKLSSNLPFECPEYEKESPLYREADASLIHFLLLDLYTFLPKEKQTEIVDKVLKQVESLVSPCGIKRYQGDSYQGLSFYTNRTSALIKGLYNSTSGDSSELDIFQQRATIVPAGHEAEWTHPLWQLSHACGKLADHFNDSHYRDKQRDYFLLGLSLITGEGEYTITDDGTGEMTIAPVPAFRIPECYNTEVFQDQLFCYPSMHTSLYWSVAECLAAFDQMPQP